MMRRNPAGQLGLPLVLALTLSLLDTIGCSRVPTARQKNLILSVGPENADVTGNDNTAIQTAIDRAAAAGGGTVVIKAANYILHNSVRLASHVTLRGEGSEKTILKKDGDVRSRLHLDADSSDFQATVEDARRFAPGMGVVVFDNFAFQGLFPNVKTIRRIDGSTLFFTDYVALDYMVDRSGEVSNFFPLVSGYGVEDVSIRDLTLDGNRSGKETEIEVGRIGGGAVYFYHSKKLDIRNIVARNVAGDGISTQFVQDPVIENCEVYGNAALGIHLGTEALRGIVRRNRSHNNGLDGLYLCWTVQHGSFEENECRANGRDGISVGHRDTDNTFVRNVARDNVRAGVELRNEPMNPGNRNTFRENVIEDNGRPDAPGYGIRIEGPTEYISLISNTIRDSRAMERSAQHLGIYIGPRADYITCEGNIIDNLKNAVVDESKGAHNKLAQLKAGRPINP